MALFDQSSLNPGVRGREVFGWAMYDFANSGYTTVVLTAVFNAYFVGAVAGNASWATLLWTATLAASSLAVMLTAPAIGAYADAHRAKKRLLLISTIACVASTAGLALVGPAMVALAVLLIVISNYFYAIGETLIAAFLPELSRPESLGKVSGWGWSFGYFGGMLALGLSLAWVIHAQGAGQPASSFVPVTMLITAVIYLLAASLTFAWLRERGREPATARSVGKGLGAAVRESFARLGQTWGHARSLTDMFWMLVCGCAYQAGIAVVIALAAVYAEQVMNFEKKETMLLVFVVNIASALGAFGFGYIQDRIGHRRALALTLLGWIVMVLLAALGGSRPYFWAAAWLAGLCMGSSQSAGRAIVGLLAPSHRVAEFYGLWAFATRLSAVIGPITYGLVTWGTGGDHRTAILVTGLFFVAGLITLARIDLDRGAAAARAYRD
ncbi:MAG: MFS transporter [Burkholderiaceae bacterium]|nr:MFS transporter [Burkholderiaceae bacterium]